MKTGVFDLAATNSKSLDVASLELSGSDETLGVLKLLQKKQKFDFSTQVDQNFSSFDNIFTECVNRHAPLKIIPRKNINLVKKPWITEAISKFIQLKQKMYISE